MPFPVDRNNNEHFLTAGIQSRQIGEYFLQERLGSGSFATVFKAVRYNSLAHPDNQSSTLSDDESAAAVKVINRQSDKITKKVLENLEMEISILRSYRHPNIVCLKEVQKTDQHFFLILEFCAGGDVQQLIRSRKAGRLSEKLTRRLMRDLTAGLDFLFKRQLIHRDIKPQNLLLTGPLPLDESEDFSKTETDEEYRNKADFPTDRFHLKIADFGFARHLQSTSLADTLCGSPLYMAPEILQHKKYDAKADLWSAGAVLFEMISGYPPFTGENHLDLLHNIQHKPVRLPRDVRVSKECVNLLRLLLNRNPLHRAGFQEFFDATEAFVSLGCSGIALRPAQSDDEAESTSVTPMLISRKNSLGPIFETEESNVTSSENVLSDESAIPNANTDLRIKQTNDDITVTQTLMPAQLQKTDRAHPSTIATSSNSNSQCLISTRYAATINPLVDVSPPTLLPYQSPSHRVVMNHASFMPLKPSPPNSFPLKETDQLLHPLSPLSLDSSTKQDLSLPILSHPCINQEISPRNAPYNQPKGSNHALDENEFVMVEIGLSQESNPRNETKSTSDVDNKTTSILLSHTGSHARTVHRMASMPSSPSSPLNLPAVSFSRDIIATKNTIHPAVNSGNKSPSLTSKMFKGLLSTSPGTGGALMGWMSSSPSQSSSRRNSMSYGTSANPSLALQSVTDSDNNNYRMNVSVNMARNASAVGFMIKTLAAAEDVGRRAIQVANIGDHRALFGMRSLILTTSQEPATTASPLAPFFMQLDSADDPMNSIEYQLCCSSIRKNDSKTDDDDENDMPFALTEPEESNPVPMVPSRKDCIINSWKPQKKSVNSLGLSADICFQEALSCYIKSMSLLKSSIHAVKRLLSELSNLEASNGFSRSPLSYSAANLKQSVVVEFESPDHFRKRCEGSYEWLAGQFKCILERADAANNELSKVAVLSKELAVSRGMSTSRKVEEIIYNHALECGRDGTVKQLLGHFEAARSCYRSAGLLVETLLMEPLLMDEDKKVLEEYVVGFCDRILEVDTLSRG